jgi:hypothetical protein
LLACSSNPFERKVSTCRAIPSQSRITRSISKTDPFTILDGRYVGHDGFVVPKDFNEFHERFPEYVRNWIRRHVDRSTPIEDVEDWTQDLLIYLRCLPATSKHREAGKEDIVQTFDPQKHHGANAARFFNYINLCLGNKLSSLRSKQMKNPVCRAGTLSLTTHWEGEDDAQVGDEFCHAHSEHLRRRCRRQEEQRDARRALAEFTQFLEREDSSVLPAMEAIAPTATPGAAAKGLRITKTELRRLSNRLRKLGQFFLKGEARRRRSPKFQPRYTPPREITVWQAAQSSIAWNRVELYNEVWNQPLVRLSRKYGISDVRLGKVCRKLKIPNPARGYWAKRAVGQTVEQVPLPEFKDAPAVKRLIRKSKPKIQRRGKIVPQKEHCVNLCVNNFRKIGWE